MPLVRTHASIIAGSAQNAAMSFMGIPSDPRSTLTNEEWRMNTQLRLGLPLASYHNEPHAPCPHGCSYPLSKEPVKVRYGYHLHHVLVTDCLKANQGKKSLKDVKATIIDHFNTYINITATKAKPFPDGKQADLLLSCITSIDNPTARNWHLDVTSTNPMGVTNQELTLATSRAHGSTTPATTSLQSAKRAEERKHTKYDAICTATGVGLVTFRARDDGRARCLPPCVGVP